MTSPLLDLQSSLKVQPDTDQVQITLTLPSELVGDFVLLLESLTRFAHSVKIKNHQLKRPSLEQRRRLDEQARKAHEEYYQRLRDLFDQVSGHDLNRRTIIKKISATLRKENHPWSSPDLVRSALADAGRPGQPGRPRRQS